MHHKFSLLLSLILLSSYSLADIYIYEGPDLDGLQLGEYAVDPPRRITGYIETSEPIPGDVIEFDVSPILTGWSFTDGFVSISNNDGIVDAVWYVPTESTYYPDPPIVSTDSEGNITAARIVAWRAPLFTEIDQTNDTLQIQGFPPPFFPAGATGNVAGTVICVDAGPEGCYIVGFGLDTGFSQLSSIGTWSREIDAVEETAQLADDVMALELKNNIEKPLTSKLANALMVLEDSSETNDVAAGKELSAFSSNVAAQSGKSIPTRDADALISKASKSAAYIESN